MKKIAVKLTCTFISLILISSLLTFVSAVFFTPNIRHELQQNQESIATTITVLSEKTNLTMKEIATIASNSMYDVSIVSASDVAAVDNSRQFTFKNGELHMSDDNRFGGTLAFLLLDEHLFQIRLQPHNTLIKLTASRHWFSGIAFVIIGALLMMITANKIVTPIVRLTEATQEIAKGNFNIHVDYKSHDEIGQLSSNFNTMARELQHIETLRKDFISNVSHEFKTPIASILGFSKLLQQNNLSEEERQDYLAIIADESTRLSHLSSNMIRLSKLESQEIVHRNNSFYLDEQIRRNILLLEPEWTHKEIQWEINLDRAMMTGDEELLQQVWINLLHNAIKFSNTGQTIGVSLSHTKEGVLFMLSDEGLGMTEEVQNHIFEKFFQGDTSHASVGSGLGLALVKRIIDLHQGTIQVSSRPGQGTTFQISLPIDH